MWALENLYRSNLAEQATLKERMVMQERINRQGLRYIGAIGYAVKRLWESACKFDGVDPASKFVVFSDGNRFAALHDKAVKQYQEAVAQYKAGGYVGLR